MSNNFQCVGKTQLAQCPLPACYTYKTTLHPSLSFILPIRWIVSFAHPHFSISPCSYSYKKILTAIFQGCRDVVWILFVGLLWGRLSSCYESKMYRIKVMVVRFTRKKNYRCTRCFFDIPVKDRFSSNPTWRIQGYKFYFIDRIYVRRGFLRDRRKILPGRFLSLAL